MSFDFTKTIIDGIKIWIKKNIEEKVINIKSKVESVEQAVETKSAIGHKHSYADLTGVPSFEGFASISYVDESLANLVDSAPDALNTLSELSTALNDDENFAVTVTNQIASKADADHAHNWEELENKPFYDTRRTHFESVDLTYNKTKSLLAVSPYTGEYEDIKYKTTNNIDSNFKAEDGALYDLTINGVVYKNCPAIRHEPPYAKVVNICVNCDELWAQKGCAVPADTSMPAYILSTGYTQPYLIYTTDVLENNFVISLYGGLFEKLDQKFIPDSIKVPPYTSEDDGKFLRIVNGAPTWVTIPNAEDGAF